VATSALAGLLDVLGLTDQAAEVGLEFGGLRASPDRAVSTPSTQPPYRVATAVTTIEPEGRSHEMVAAPSQSGTAPLFSFVLAPSPSPATSSSTAATPSPPSRTRSPKDAQPSQPQVETLIVHLRFPSTSKHRLMADPETGLAL